MPRPHPTPVSVALSVTLLCLALLPAGCGKAPGPVLDLKISDGDWNDYNRSLEAIAERQTAAERIEFAKALQELKYHAMSGEGEAPGPGVNASVREQVAGLAVRQVLVTGLSIKLGRKQAEEKALVRSILKNKRLRTKPGDEASAAFLASTHASQARQLFQLRAEISALTSRINELQPGRIPPVAPAAPSEELDSVVAAGELDERPQLQKEARPDARRPF